MGDLAPFFAPGAGGRSVVPYYINPSVVGNMLSPFVPKIMQPINFASAARAVYAGYQRASNPMRLSAGRPIQRLPVHKAPPIRKPDARRQQNLQQKTIQQTLARKAAVLKSKFLMTAGYGSRRLNRLLYLNRGRVGRRLRRYRRRRW